MSHNAGPRRAVGGTLNRTAGTPRATRRPVRSKEPREASRRAWGCGIRGGRDTVLAIVTGRGCEYIFVCGSKLSYARPNAGWIRLGVDWLPGRCPTRGKEQAKE